MLIDGWISKQVYGSRRKINVRASTPLPTMVSKHPFLEPITCEIFLPFLSRRTINALTVAFGTMDAYRSCVKCGIGKRKRRTNPPCFQIVWEERHRLMLVRNFGKKGLMEVYQAALNFVPEGNAIAKGEIIHRLFEMEKTPAAKLVARARDRLVPITPGRTILGMIDSSSIGDRK